VGLPDVREDGVEGVVHPHAGVIALDDDAAETVVVAGDGGLVVGGVGDRREQVVVVRAAVESEPFAVVELLDGSLVQRPREPLAALALEAGDGGLDVLVHVVESVTTGLETGLLGLEFGGGDALSAALLDRRLGFRLGGRDDLVGLLLGGPAEFLGTLLGGLASLLGFLLGLLADFLDDGVQAHYTTKATTSASSTSVSGRTVITRAVPSPMESSAIAPTAAAPIPRSATPAP
jgi:hypothetical protein